MRIRKSLFFILILFFTFFLSLSDPNFKGNCYTMYYTSPNFVRGEETDFTVVLFSNTDNVNHNYFQIDFSDVPNTTYTCETEKIVTYPKIENVALVGQSGTNFEIVECSVEIPITANTTGSGSRYTVINVTKSDCGSDFAPLVYSILAGDELDISVAPSVLEVERRPDVTPRFVATVTSKAPHDMTIDFEAEGISEKRMNISETRFTLNNSSRSVLLDINTSNMFFGEHNITLTVESPSNFAETEATLRVVPSSGVQKAQFEGKERIQTLSEKVETYSSEGWITLEEEEILKGKLSEATALLEQTYIKDARERMDYVNETLLAVTPPEEAPSETQANYEKVNVPTISTVKHYLPLILLISVAVVVIAVLLPLRKMYLSNVEVGKITEKLSDREFVVRLRIKNKSFFSIKGATVAEEVPAGFKLKDTFKIGKEKVRASESKGKGGSKIYTIDLNEVKKGKEIVITYSLSRPTASGGVVELPQFALRYTFRGKEEIVKSNRPIL